MIIPVDFILPSSSNLKLPPSVAKVSHDEIVLVELQGTLDVESTYEGERDGKLVGQLTLDDDLVTYLLVFHASQLADAS